MRHQISIDVGRLLCRGFRDYLKGMKLTHPSLEWHESGGLISHTFWVIGSTEAIARVSMEVQILVNARAKTPHVE